MGVKERLEKGLVKVPGGTILIAKMADLMAWARKSSMWSLTFGLSCCAIEMMATAASRYDLDRFGMFFRATPRQADVMIVAGWVSVKMAPFIKRLYEQMPEPKYVIAMGGCASAGGPYRDSITIVKGVDQFVPVDVYVYGCPPRPENLILGILKLQERIQREHEAERNGLPKPVREPIIITETGGNGMNEAIQELLGRFGEAVQEWTQVTPNEVRFTVSSVVWREVAQYLRDAPLWQMDYPADLTVWDTGNEFWLYLRLWSSVYNHNVILFTAISREEPRIASLATLYPGVDWHEREMYDMYGVIFEGHPNLKRILLPDDWEGFPFRKDYVAVPSGDPLRGPQPVD